MDIMDFKKICCVFCSLILSAVLLSSCQQDDMFDVPEINNPGEEVSLSFIGDPMQRYQVTTKSSDPKEEAEKEIKQLCVFFFGSDGNYLTGGYLKGYDDKNAGGFIAPGQGVSLIKIDKSNFDNADLAKSATVYAVANVDISIFGDLDNNGRPSNIRSLSDLENFNYFPGEENVTLGLPSTGMPMVGKKVVDLTGDTGTNEDRIITMEALMARVDLNIRLESAITENGYPKLTMINWKVSNLPTQVSFTAPAQNSYTPALGENKKEISIDNTQQIVNKQGEIELSFYMFENRQNKKVDNNEWIEIGSKYPEGLEDYQQQRYKPYLADKDNATSVELHTYYSTYNEDGSGSSTYEVRYTLYLGSNHKDDFQVKRNHQYKNNMVIKGLVQAGNNPEHITFDARLNITEDDNEYYIAILRERNHDAHFCITPMDVYLFADAEKEPRMEVILGEVPVGSETSVPSTVANWIRMEKVPASDMQTGSVAEPSKQLVAGPNFVAGHGKRRYFTPWLLSEDLKDGTKVTIDKSRDRVYFYLDENLKMEDRSALVTFIYKEKQADGSWKEVKRRTLTIGQVHLLEVKVYGRDGDKPDGNLQQTIYMEQYEEYLDHYDPLDEHQTDQMYTGLQWGINNYDIDNAAPRDRPAYAFENYYDGLYYTNFIVNKASQTVMCLNDIPRSAVEYCYNRNKRGWYGSGAEDGGGVREDDKKWFLPGIRQMEDALTEYYYIYPEFQNNFYWSSSTAKRSYRIGDLSEREDTERARATKVKPDGSYVQSGSKNDKDNYEKGGGKAKRIEKLRIRAFRTDLQPIETER